MLILGLATVANATVTYEIRDAAGTTVVDPMALDIALDYTLFISGAAADAHDGMLVGPAMTQDDWTVIQLTNGAILDTGDLSNLEEIDEPGLYLWTYGTADSGFGPGVSTGDWFEWTVDTLTEGTFTIDFYDFNVSDSVPVASIPGEVVPEPVTLALLGLGGLFLRRRR